MKTSSRTHTERTLILGGGVLPSLMKKQKDKQFRVMQKGGLFEQKNPKRKVIVNKASNNSLLDGLRGWSDFGSFGSLSGERLCGVMSSINYDLRSLCSFNRFCWLRSSSSLWKLWSSRNDLGGSLIRVFLEVIVEEL